MGLDFPRIVEDNQAVVFSIALRFLRDRASAEDLAQDVFLQLYRQIGKIESFAHASWWLRRAICHRCIDESRKRRLRVRLVPETMPEPSVQSREDDPLLDDKLRAMVEDLPEHARAVMVLRYQEDMDPAEIAKMLGMPVSTVKSHLHRSLALLRGKLERQRVTG